MVVGMTTTTTTTTGMGTCVAASPTRARARASGGRCVRCATRTTALLASSSSSAAAASSSSPSSSSVGGCADAGTRRGGGPSSGRRVSLLGAALAAATAATTLGDDVARARSSATVRAPSPMRGAVDGGGFECATTLPRGYHLTRGANSRYEVTPGGARGALTADDDGAAVVTMTIRVDAPSEAVDGDVVGVDCVVYFCRDEDVCLAQRVRFEAVVRDDAVDAVARAAFLVPGEASDAAVATGTFSVPSFD